MRDSSRSSNGDGGEKIINREKHVSFCCFVGTSVNLILFFMKLYVSLSSNSISIWSDAVNNLADCLSCLLSAVCMLVSIKFIKSGLSFVVGRVERLLSLLLSLAVAFVGLSFAYSSLERFMYPTPIWFSVKFAVMIAVTAIGKLLLFVFYGVQEKKSDSSVIKVMKADSMLDFFITLTTLVSFTLTRYTEFAIDAVFGLAISIFITVGAIKMLKEAICGVLGLIKTEKREKFFDFLEGENITPEKTVFSIEEGEKEYAVVLLSAVPEKDESSLQKLCKEKTGINLIFTINQNKGESQ